MYDFSVVNNLQLINILLVFILVWQHIMSFICVYCEKLYSS